MSMKIAEDIDSMGSSNKHHNSVMAPIKLENQQIHSGIMAGEPGAKYLQKKDTEALNLPDYPR